MSHSPYEQIEPHQFVTQVVLMNLCFLWIFIGLVPFSTLCLYELNLKIDARKRWDLICRSFTFLPSPYLHYTRWLSPAGDRFDIIVCMQSLFCLTLNLCIFKTLRNTNTLLSLCSDCCARFTIINMYWIERTAPSFNRTDVILWDG